MAQAILLKDVDKLGESGDVIDVSPGYLRNFLVPRKLAQPATPAAIADSQRRRDAAERAVADAAAKAEETAALRLRDRRRRGRLGELARNEEVAQVPGSDVDHVAALAEIVNFLQEDCLGHA